MKKLSFNSTVKYLKHRNVDVDNIIKKKSNNQKFIEASLRERFALKHIEKVMGKGIEYQMNYTPAYSYDSYDAVFMRLDNGSIKKTYLIEAKIREKHYPKLMLESKKLKSIKTKILSPDTEILYIVFTPEGTFCYNVTKLEREKPEEFNITYIECPKETMGDDTEINKAVYLLNTELSKKIDFIFRERDYLDSIKVKIKKPQDCPLFGKQNNNM